MEKNKTEVKKEHFKLENILNKPISVGWAGPCERKCMKCEVNSKHCNHS